MPDGVRSELWSGRPHPLVSVVVPCRGGQDRVERLAAMFAEQHDPPPFEVILVDDGNEPPLQVGVQSSGEAITVVRVPHGGVSTARNAGIAAARGELITFLDSDDSVTVDWLHRMTAPFADDTVGLVCCGAMITQPGLPPVRRTPKPLGPLYSDTTGLFLAGTFCVRRQILREVGGYVDGLRFGENAEIGIRITRQLASSGQRVHRDDETLLLYERAATRTHRHLDIAQSSEWVLRLHRDQFNRDRRALADYLNVAGFNYRRAGELGYAQRAYLRSLFVRPGPKSLMRCVQLGLLRVLAGLRAGVGRLQGARR